MRPHEIRCKLEKWMVEVVYQQTDQADYRGKSWKTDPIDLIDYFGYENVRWDSAAAGEKSIIIVINLINLCSSLMLRGFLSGEYSPATVDWDLRLLIRSIVAVADKLRNGFVGRQSTSYVDRINRTGDETKW